MTPLNAPDYYQQSRPEVAALVPQDARRILDVGCGFGSLGRLLLQSRRCELHGIERNPLARPYLDEAYARFEIADAEQALSRFAGELYDCIVFADILEHLVDPWSVLKEYSLMLNAGGCVVSSIPNVRNLALLFNLAVRGRWQYAEHGLLDRTHLRFFTRREIEQLFRQAGLVIETWAENRDRFAGLRQLVSTLPVLIIPDLGVCQFLVRARRAGDQ